MTFQKGQSGNPGGRKPVDPAIKAALEALTPKAVKTLGELLDSDDDKVRCSAAQAVLDRNLGKPSQSLEVGGPGGGPVRVEAAVQIYIPDNGRGDASGGEKP